METSQKKMATLLDENKRLVHELKTMQGLIQKLSQQSTSTAYQVLDLTKRGMEQNLIIHGADDSIEVEDQDREKRKEAPTYAFRERPKLSALKFFREELDLDFSIEDVWKAHRTGPFRENKTRPLIVKVAYKAKERIMENISKLKGRSNPKTGQVFFVSEQIPEGISEIKKQTTARANHLKEINEKKPKESRSKIQIINDKILVDGQLDMPEIQTPQPSQLLFLQPDEQRRVNLVQQKLMETEPETIRNSEFIAMAVKIHSLEELNAAYIAAAQRYPAADHVILGYAFRDDKSVKSGFCDDREHGAGSRIRKTIFELKARNVAVFVVRKFGGIHLGFQRFGVIEEIAKKAIELLNN